MERKRTGFTLVELLVVVVIIGMLVGLLVPAVISARERARQGLCMNRFRELGTATIHYESARGRFPGWRNAAPMLDSDGDRRDVSWAVALFSYLGREDLWRDWQNGEPPVTENPDGLVVVEQLVCPSDSGSATTRGALSYVANTGHVDERNHIALGIFHDRGYETSNPTTVSIEYIDRHDGTSTTLMLSERLISSAHQAIRRWDNVQDTGYEATGFLWEGAPNDILPPDDATVTNHISSNHPGGMGACFADGHYRFLRDTIEYDVYQALMTPNGRIRVDGDGKPVERVVSDVDF